MRIEFNRHDVKHDVPPSIFRQGAFNLPDTEHNLRALNLMKGHHPCFTLCAGGNYNRIRYLVGYLVWLHKARGFNNVCWHYLNNQPVAPTTSLLVLDLISNEYNPKTVNNIVDDNKLERLRDLHENFAGIKIILSPVCPKKTMKVLRLGFEAMIHITNQKD